MKVNVDNFVRFESGEMSDDEQVNFLQSLIDDGSIASLQGCYGRAAVRLIKAGKCYKKGDPKDPRFNKRS